MKQIKNYSTWVLVAMISTLMSLVSSPATAQMAPDAGQGASYFITNRQLSSDLTPQNSIQSQVRSKSAKQECDSTCALTAGLNPTETRTLACPVSFTTLQTGQVVQIAGGQITQVAYLQTDGSYSAWQNATGGCWNNSEQVQN